MISEKNCHISIILSRLESIARQFREVVIDGVEFEFIMKHPQHNIS